MSGKALSDYVRVGGRFHRSVQLAYDVNNAQNLREYILTPTAYQLAEQILDGLKRPAGERTWSITGPYGTGKSAFALYLHVLLCEPSSRDPKVQILRREAQFRARAFVPILIMGQRIPFIPAFLTAMAQGIKSVSPAIARRISRVAAEQHLAGHEIVSLLEQAATAATGAGRGGLLVMVDEFGKFLEHAALHPDTEDLLVLQQLAEAAARSPSPILLITILHSAFADYIHSADQVQRMEWQKVQGRFTDVTFVEPPEQVLRLVGTAIERKLSSSTEKAYRTIVNRAIRRNALDEAQRRFTDQDLLIACVPLHPVTALILWPVFRSKLAQNERSLFAFLTSQEPFGFQEFLATVHPQQAKPIFYCVDRFYDYVVTALGAAAYAGDRAHRWAEIGHALDRLSADAPPLTSAVIKAVGLIGLYGAQVGLRPSEEVLALALSDADGVANALSYLQGASILVYRKHEKAYGLWEGSDVDLEARFDDARQLVGRGDLAAQIKELIELRPIVARAHYIRTGTLRYFAVNIITGSDQALRDALSQPKALADGQILYVLTPSVRDHGPLVELARILTVEDGPERRLRVLAFPKPMIGLEEAIQDVQGWHWVSENVPELQGDPVARKEVRARSLQVRDRLEDIVGQAFGLQGQPFEPEMSTWVQGGKLQPARSAREFLNWLSNLCDKVFDAAPILRNELLNRDRLSSASAAARRNLLEAMLTRETQPQLGFGGTPPEVSMYRSMLLDGGFHHHNSDAWQFEAPGPAWQPAWHAIHDFLEATRTGRRPIEELFASLKRAPFGLREGPLPVILCAVLLAHRDDVALYEDSVFVAELRIEVIERLLRMPQSFEIQQHLLKQQDRRAFAAISDVLQALQLDTTQRLQSSPLLGIVRPLVMFAARLPAYTKNTKRIDPPGAIAMRDALLRSRDPYSLMKDELPVALGLTAGSGADLDRFPGLLRDALLGLQRSYARLLDEIETQIRDVFDLHGTAIEVRQRLKSRAVPLENRAADRALALWVREASRLDDSRDWREILGRVVNGGLPPHQWHDANLVDFQVRLRQLASDFVRLEELQAEQRQTGATQIFRIGLLEGQLHEAREIVAVTPERAPAVLELADRLLLCLTTQPTHEPGNSDETRRINLAALAMVAGHYLWRNGSTQDA